MATARTLRTGKTRKSAPAKAAPMSRQELARELADVRARFAALPPEVSALIRILVSVNERRLLTPAA